MSSRFSAHPTAIIDDGVQIGPDTRICHWVHICAGAQIGARCSFGQNVFIGNDVVISNNCKVQNNVSLYDVVTLGDDVFCGPSMVFANVHNPRAAVNRKDQYRRTLVKQGATIGANATILCGLTLGDYCFIAAGGVITKDVKPYALMAGVPARQIGWMSQHGERPDLPLTGCAQVTCPATGQGYRLIDGEIGR